jgi:serine/threonine-protein kinase
LHQDHADPQHKTRFEREVQLTAALTHPNTISVYDYGHTPDGIFYYAMEYLDGFNLDELVELDGPQPPARVIHLITQACGALSEAHAVGLIHRDIKPANVFICERGGQPDVVKVLDFGLVKNISTADPTLSNVNTIAGTPLYMAPESVVDPSSVDARSDVYALGAVAYFLITGTHVFSGASVVEICGHHLHTPPEPPSHRLGKAVPTDLEAVVLASLAKEPSARPQSARALAERLSACHDANGWSEDAARRWWSQRPARPTKKQARPQSPSRVLEVDARARTEAI